MRLVPAAVAARRGVRLGVDAPARAGAAVADGVASALERQGRQVARVEASGFLHPRSVRLEHGPHDAETAYHRWYDAAALRREVLDPLADPGAMRWLPALRREDSDRSVRAAPVAAAPGAVAVVDGPYLLRDDLADAFELVVHLHVSPAALARLHPPPSAVPDAWRRYREDCEPAGRAALVVRWDHPDRPAVLTR